MCWFMIYWVVIYDVYDAALMQDAIMGDITVMILQNCKSRHGIV